MTQAIILLLSIVAVLAPLLSGRPDEPLWSSFFACAAGLAGLFAVASAWRQSSALGTPASLAKARWATVGLAAWVLLSILARIVRQHSATAFLAPMLRGGGALTTDLAFFLTAWYLSARHRDGRYLLMLAIIGGSAIAAAIGVQEYAIHLRDGEKSWRVFGTSTPDYLAAYMAMTLPLTIALLLSAPTENRLPVLVGLVAVLQIATLGTTGSRFAVVSLVLSFAVFGFFAYRQKKLAAASSEAPVAAKSRAGTIASAALAIVVVAVFATPVVRRLTHNDANSGAFRVWTWKGSLHMAAANPIFGTGPGTYVYDYPRYALTGFTRLAHNGYLQLADECGVPALLFFLAILIFLISAIVAALRSPLSPEAAEEPSRLAASVQKGNDRLLLAGLLAGLVAAMVQNLIDSDWSVYFFHATFWLIAGIAAGVAQREIGLKEASGQVKRLPLALAGVCAGVLSLFTLTNGIGAIYSDQAKSAVSGEDAEAAYAAAQSWSPWDGRNLSDLAYKVYLVRQHNPTLAETTLKNAISLEPSYLTYRRLGNLYKSTGRTNEAIQAYEQGLRQDPNSLDLMLDLASISPPDAALDYYRKMQTLEQGPVGTVRALGDITEERFAQANAALGDDAVKHGDIKSAISDYDRAAAVLEKYADEGGQSNPQRGALLGGQSDPERENELAQRYHHVIEELLKLDTDQIKAAKDSDTVFAKYSDPVRQLYYSALFESLVGAAYQATGDIQNALQRYDDAAKQIENRVNLAGSPETDKDHLIAPLYANLLDKIAPLSGPDQSGAIDARRSKFTPIIDSVFKRP